MDHIFKFIILLLLFSCSANEKEITIVQEDDKFIFDKGIQLIEEKIIQYLDNDIDLKKTDKLLKIILFAAVFELLFKHNNPKKVVISEYLLASEYFLEKVQIGYLNAILDKISKVLRKDE